jgi:PAS domain S-box-containing protein
MAETLKDGNPPTASAQNERMTRLALLSIAEDLKDTETVLREREQFLALLNNITNSIITARDWDVMIKELVMSLKILLEADDCYLTRWDEETGKTIPLSATAKLENPYRSIQLPSNETSMTQSVLRERRTLVADDVFNSPYISAEIAKLFPSRSLLGIPLLYGKAMLGAILVAYNTPHTFNQREIERAERAVGQISIAMWSVQKDIELKKRLNEQETLAQITTTLSQTERVGLSNVLNLIVGSARELIPDAQQAVIHLMDKDQAFLIPEAVSGFDVSEEGKGKMRVGQGVAGQVMSHGRTVYISDIHKDDRFVNLNPNVKYHSLMVAPVAGLGTISIQSEKTHAFSENEINLLTELGQQAAIAIENARLYDAVQGELRERRQVEAALRSSEERYRRISEDMPAMICRFLADGTLTFINTYYSNFFGKSGSELIGHNLLDFINEENRNIVLSNYLSLNEFNPFATYENLETDGYGNKRWIQWIDRIIDSEDGSVAEYQSIGIDVTDRKLAEIEREQLLQAERTQRLLAETSADATLALVSHTEQGEVLNEILIQVQKLLPGCAANITLVEGDQLRTMAWRGYENRGGEIISDMILNANLFPLEKTIFENLTPNIITDTRTNPLWITIPGLEWIRSNLSIPLLWNNQLLGLLYIDEDKPNEFSEETVRRLQPLINAATAALENTLLIETTRKALKETNALYHINQKLAALDVDELANDVVELLKREFNYYHVQLYVINPATNELFLKAASGEIGKKLLEQKLHTRRGEGVIGYAAETLKPFFTNNVDDVIFYIRHPLLTETKAEMAIPVRNGGKLFGILDIQQAAHKPFTPQDQQLVETVADQLAAALQKAELYENLQTSLQQEKMIRNQLVQNERLAIMGRLLASVSHELNNPLQAIQNALFLLKEEHGISEQGKQDLEIVLAESERMASMIERLRDTYRPTQAEDFKPIQLNRIIEDVHALIATHLRKNQIAFVFQPYPDLPFIYALSDQVRQVVLNLFMNAVEAMSSGDVLTAQTEYLSETNQILLSVSDTGTGISPSILPDIFEPFITDKKSGTGLGLTISRDIVIKHRGNITAENNPERGATFKVWLPISNREIE